MDLKALRNYIENIGRELVKCPLRCEGIVNSPEKGIIPRCLILEESNLNILGCIIVGINPGSAKRYEREAYMKNCSYNQVLYIWQHRIRNLRYYKYSRGLAEKLGFRGAILWTEICKCEKRQKQKDIPIETIRKCINRYLIKELNAVEKTVGAQIPIIALGNTAYQILCLLFPNFFIIGVPHPTGSYGHFAELSRDENIILAKQKIDEAKRKGKSCVKIFPRQIKKSLSSSDRK